MGPVRQAEVDARLGRWQSLDAENTRQRLWVVQLVLVAPRAILLLPCRLCRRPSSRTTLSRPRLEAGSESNLHGRRLPMHVHCTSFLLANPILVFYEGEQTLILQPVQGSAESDLDDSRMATNFNGAGDGGPILDLRHTHI